MTTAEAADVRHSNQALSLDRAADPRLDHTQYISDSQLPQAHGHLRNAIDKGDNPSHAAIQPDHKPPKDFEEFLQRFDQKLIEEDGGVEAGRKRLEETYVDEKHLGWYGYINVRSSMMRRSVMRDIDSGEYSGGITMR